jgi:hypothetical protein
MGYPSIDDWGGPRRGSRYVKALKAYAYEQAKDIGVNIFKTNKEYRIYQGGDYTVTPRAEASFRGTWQVHLVVDEARFRCDLRTVGLNNIAEAFLFGMCCLFDMAPYMESAVENLRRKQDVVQYEMDRLLKLEMEILDAAMLKSISLMVRGHV